MVGHKPSRVSIKKQAARLTGSFFIGLLVGFLLVLLIGYLVDIASYPWLRKIGDRALNQFRSRQADTVDNAWQYYMPALSRVLDDPPSDSLNAYVFGGKPLSPYVEEEMARRDGIYELLQRGAERPGGLMPIDFRKSWNIRLTQDNQIHNLMVYSLARSLAQLDRGENDASLRSIFNGLTFTRRLIDGVPMLGNYSRGIIWLQRQLGILRIGLVRGQFTADQLSTIQKYLTGMETGFPEFRWVIEGEININKIGFASIPVDVPLETGVLIAGRLWVKKYLRNPISLRFRLWRYGFSTRLATIFALKYWDRIILALNRQEERYLYKTWPDGKDSLTIINPQAYRYAQKNPIFPITMPLLSGFFRIKTEMLARIRMLNLACQIWMYELRNQEFPRTLEKIEGYTAIEPFTGDAWHYSWFRDSVIITSPGFNRVYGDVNDLSLTLRKQK